MSEEIAIKKSTDFTMFVPAFIDDYGFTPEEFRVFSRIMRRSIGEHSQGCYETIPKMALSLGIAQRSVRRALKVLRGCGAISVIERKGSSHLLSFRPCEKWTPSIQLASIRFEAFGGEIDADRERKLTPVGNDRGVGNDNPPLSEMTTKGYPSKGIPQEYADAISEESVLPPESEKDAKDSTTLTPFQVLMQYHAKRIGTVLDGGVQGSKIKTLLTHFSVADCIACYEFQLSESWRNGNVSWASVASGQTGIAQWKAKQTVKPKFLKIDVDAAELEWERSKLNG